MEQIIVQNDTVKMQRKVGISLKINWYGNVCVVSCCKILAQVLCRCNNVGVLREVIWLLLRYHCVANFKVNVAIRSKKVAK